MSSIPEDSVLHYSRAWTSHGGWG